MMISKQWIQRGVLCGLLLGGVGGCSMVASPSVSQVAPTDHAGLVAWYDNEAAQLRQKAKDMEQMADRFQNDPVLRQTESAGIGKRDVVQHCQALASMYAKSAEEADALSRLHRGMRK